MQNQFGQTWHVGAIVNGQVLTEANGWVRLRFQPNHGGPWQPGDAVDGLVYTGATWVVLPGAWRPDPTGWFHQRASFPAPPIRPHKGFWQTVYKASKTAHRLGEAFLQVILGLYCAFWLVVVVYAGSVAYIEDNPRYLSLLAPAASQLLIATLIGKKKFQKSTQKAVPYIWCGVGAAVGIWASLHFNSAQLMTMTLVLFFFGLMIAWVSSS